jgi:hypothetical protein
MLLFNHLKKGSTAGFHKETHGVNKTKIMHGKQLFLFSIAAAKCIILKAFSIHAFCFVEEMEYW